MEQARSGSSEAQASIRAWSPDGPSDTKRPLGSLFGGGGDLLPTQLAKSSIWSAEKYLAAAVLDSALVEIRDHYGEKGHRRPVKEALEWVHSDDTEWPYAFIALCELFALDPAWVRERVAAWTAAPQRPEVTRVRYRHAA
jgi:hypothetical protein